MYFFKVGSHLRVFQTSEDMREMYRTQENFDHIIEYVYWVSIHYNIKTVEWVLDKN